MVTGEVADLVEKDNADIRLLLNPSLTTTAKYIHNSRGLLAERRSRIIPLPRKDANTNIYVGNLSLEVTEEELRGEFMAFGEVISVIIRTTNILIVVSCAVMALLNWLQKLKMKPQLLPSMKKR